MFWNGFLDISIIMLSCDWSVNMLFGSIKIGC